jgi:DNA (cytosine-5)-methyltransferase 1
MSTNVDATDLFCGGGGSLEGLKEAGIEGSLAVNHWPLAVSTHQKNHPGAEHDCADISQIDPRRYRSTTILWASPDCTRHTKASGNKRDVAAHTSDGVTLPSDPGERSRATMWDVVRFSEYHQYEAVIVENVIEATQWGPFGARKMAMESLGYVHNMVWMSSAHASAGGPAAATHRNRWYDVMTRAGARLPDLAKWTSPHGQCTTCGTFGRLVKWWKKGNDVAGGVYGKNRQYLFRCASCTALVDPQVVPASTLIDWTRTGRSVLDGRNVDLVEKTIAKIVRGLPLHAVDGMAQPFIVELRGGGSSTRAITEPLSTITAKGNHHGLVVPPGYDPATGLGSVPLDQLRLADCTYRMLSPHERQLLSAFPGSYEMLGNGAEQVRLIGNAVNPPAARVLGAAVMEALTGSVNLNPDREMELAA